MNAGALTYRITLYRKSVSISASGFREELDQFIGHRLASIKKMMPSYDKDGVMAHELFDGETIVFQIRASSDVKLASEVEFEGTRYRVAMATPQLDRTLLLYCRKKDK